MRVSFQPGIEPCWTCSRWLNPEYLKLARSFCVAW